MKERTKLSPRIILFSLVIVLGMISCITVTAEETNGGAYNAFVPKDNDNRPSLYNKQVTFNGKQWYIIEDNSTSATEGSVTLLAADTSFGVSAYIDKVPYDLPYRNSTIAKVLKAYTDTGSFKDVANAIQTVVLKDAGDMEVKLYLLSLNEAQMLPNIVWDIDAKWWVRQNYKNDRPWYLYRLTKNRATNINDLKNEYVIRPALQLNLASVIFSPETRTFSIKPAESYTVIFKVAHGSWNDGTTGDKTVTVTRAAGQAEAPILAANQIPAAGRNPAAGYKAGSWDITPNAGTAITGNVTYTYTYARKPLLSAKVTFEVRNGAWNDKSRSAKTVTLRGYEEYKLRLTRNDIPGVGNQPDTTFKAGSWNVTPDTKTVFSNRAKTTYTYTYAPKARISAKVIFEVRNGAWNNRLRIPISVTLTGYEGDKLKLKQFDIPGVGSQPDFLYRAGSWDVTPDTKTEFLNGSTTTYTYTYAPKFPGLRTEENAKTALNAGLKVVWNSSNKIAVKFGTVSGADSCEVYAAYNFAGPLKKIKTVRGSSTVTITALNGKALNPKKTVRIQVIAKNGSSQLAKSLTAYVVGPQNRYTNVKSITVSKSSYTLKRGKTAKISAKAVSQDGGKQILPESHLVKFRYAISDKNVATVDQSGKITAKDIGECQVYVYAANGMAKSVKVFVTK